jgi:crossover junction endodeoxyribonuclease RuvC
MSYVIGFDPGLDGAFTVLDKFGDIVDVFDMPTVEVKVGSSMKRQVAPQAIVAELRLFARDPCLAVIEKVAARPGQGTASMFGFGRSAGILEGVLAGMLIPYRLVTPQVWMKSLKLAQGKGASRQRAMEIFPDQADRFKRVKDDGRSDGALIAVYGYGEAIK